VFLELQPIEGTVPTFPPPYHAAFRGTRGIQALHFTAMRTHALRGLDCSLGSPERRAANLENRRSVAQAFGVRGDDILTTKQRKAEVIIVAQGWNMNLRPDAHAIVMARNYDRVIGVLVNDCAPVLLADVENRVVAAVHVGWREAARDILERTLDSMACLGAQRDRIWASIGPCAGVGQSYVVGATFSSELPNKDPAIADFLSAQDGKTHFAFQKYVGERLRRCGLDPAHIDSVAADTIEDKRYYSLRRDGKDMGSMFSGIRLMPAP
jgi:YfiH family protein